MAILLQSDTVLLSPRADAPKFPDIVSNLLLSFDRDALRGLADGADVSDWAASGYGSESEKHLNLKASSWNWPTWSASGGPDGRGSVVFNGSEVLSNEGQSISLEPNVRQGPYTVGIVFKVNDWDTPSAGVSRLFAPVDYSDDLTVNYGYARPTNSQKISVVASNDSTSGVNTFFYTPPVDKLSQWACLIVSFGQQHIRTKMYGMPMIENIGEAVNFNGLALGMRWVSANSANLGNGLIGEIAAVRVYMREFTEQEMDTLDAYWCEKFNIPR